MTARSVTTDTFDKEVLASDKPIVVDFWAAWCGPCRLVSPILDQINQEHSDKIEVVKVNVDENIELASRYQITSIPAMKVFKSGELVQSIIGAKSKAALEADLAEFIK